MSYQIFEDLCKKDGVTPYRVCKITGVPTSAISNWKAGRYEPKSDKRQRIADFFGVSLYYLDHGEEAQSYLELSPDIMRAVEPFIKRRGAIAFIKQCNALTDQQYSLVFQLIKEIAGGAEDDKNTEDQKD